MFRGVRHFVAAAALLAAVAYTALYGHLDSVPQIRSDGYSYYVYLPSLFLYHDATLETLANDWYGGPYPDYAGIRRWPSTHRWLNLHPIGTAIMMAPFFLAADLLTLWSNLPRDGFSLYYQHGAALAAVAYVLLGLAMLLCIRQVVVADAQNEVGDDRGQTIRRRQWRAGGSRQPRMRWCWPGWRPCARTARDTGRLRFR